jgi:hypothetical protein
MEIRTSGWVTSRTQLIQFVDLFATQILYPRTIDSRTTDSRRSALEKCLQKVNRAPRHKLKRKVFRLTHVICVARCNRGYEGMFLTCFGCSGQKYALISALSAPPNALSEFLFKSENNKEVPQISLQNPSYIDT